jgi:Ca2+-binding RTX toxin-like protein
MQMAEILGTNGNDRLRGTNANDEMFGGFGDDRLIGRKGADLLDGGFGTDTASYDTSVKRVVADLSDPSRNRGDAKGDEYVSIERLIGSDNDDELRGGVNETVLFGRGGDDTLVGQFGATRLIGGVGADTLIGFGVSTVAAYWDAKRGVRVDLNDPDRNTQEAAGDVFDNISGIEGSDFRDRLYGDRRDNYLAGLSGKDDLFGGAGNDTLNGEAGRDLLDGGRGVDVAIYSGSRAGVRVDLANTAQNTGDAKGDDYVRIEGIQGSRFNDRISGDDADNRLIGAEGDDALIGRGGRDTLVGNIGDDRLVGGGDDDTLQGGAGADKLYGGNGVDSAIYWSATGAINVDLQNAGANTGEARGDTFKSIEGLGGTSFSDILRGDERNNRLLGRDGNDRLDGRDGNDILFGDAGDDSLNGGGGTDTLVGGDGADRLSGSSGIDTASYAFADSAVTVNLEDDTQNSGEAFGDTFSKVENVRGSSFDDVLTGDTRMNRLAGGAGDDTLSGGAGNDKLVGDTGADVLSGGSGRDQLFGGAGRDILTGGASVDAFVFNLAFSTAGVDDVTDFRTGVDRFELGRFIFGGQPRGALDEDAFHIGLEAADADDRIIYDDASGFLSFDADGAGGASDVRFANVTAGTDLEAGDFFFV